MRLVIAACMSLALLAACGNGESAAPSASQATTSPPSLEPTSEAPSVTSTTEIGLPHACPRLRAVVETDGLDETVAEWEALLEVLDALEVEGDASVDRVVAAVRPGIEKNRAYAVAGRPDGEGGAAFDALTEAMRAVPKLCWPS